MIRIVKSMAGPTDAELIRDLLGDGIVAQMTRRRAASRRRTTGIWYGTIKLWGDDEKAYLDRYYGKRPLRRIAHDLSRSEKAIKDMASKRGLTRGTNAALG